MAVAANLADALTMLRAGGQTVDALAALRVGQSVDATVLAKLDTGEIRLALLGTFLDIVSPETLAVGEPLRLTVVDRSGQLSVALQRLDLSRPTAPQGATPVASPPTNEPPASGALPARSSPSSPPVAVPGSAIARPTQAAPTPTIATPSTPAPRNGTGEAPVLPSSKPPAAPWIDPVALAAARAAPKSAAVPQASASYRAASAPAPVSAEGGAVSPQAPEPAPFSGEGPAAAPLATRPATTTATPPAPLSTQGAAAGNEPAPAEPSPSRLLSTPPPLAPIPDAQGAAPPLALPAALASETKEPAPPSSPPTPTPNVPGPGAEPPAAATSRPLAANVPLPVAPAGSAAPPLVRVEPVPIAPTPVASAPIEATPASAGPVQAAPASDSQAPPVPTPANPAPPAAPVSASPAQTAPGRAASPVLTPTVSQTPAPPISLPAVVAQPVTEEIDATPQPLAATAPPLPAPIVQAAVAAVVDEPAVANANAARLAVPDPQAGEPAEPAAVQVRPALSPSARQALQAMVPQAVAGQGSRAPLLANAAAILAGPAAALLPRPVRQALAELVAAALDPTELTAPALRRAVATSGTFQEASVLRLAGLLPQGAPPGDPRETMPPGQRLPVTLLPPGEAALPDALAEGTQALRLDAKTLLLALASALQNPPADTLAQPSQGERPQPLLPRLDAVPAGQPAAAADLDPREPATGIVQSLAGDTQAALDRVRLLQAASMPDNPKAPDGPQRFDRLVEIPLALPGGQMPIMSLAVGRDGKAARSGEPPAWRMRLSLDLPPAGPMHALVSLRGGRAGVTLWAEKSETADQFRAALPELRDALTVVDLDITTLDVFTGAPPGARPARAGKAVDRRS